MNFEERMEELRENILSFSKGQENEEANLQKELENKVGDKCPWCERGPLSVLVSTYDKTCAICCTQNECGMSTPWCKTFHEVYTYLQALLEARKKLEQEKAAEENLDALQ